MSELAAEQRTVPDFNSVPDLREGLDAKRGFENRPLYFRDGFVELGDLEARLAELDGIEPGTTLAYNTGMSSVTDAIDIGLHVAKPEGNLPLLACSLETYTQTKKYIEHFIRGKRAEVFYFDSGKTDSVESVLGKRQPDVVVAETISNFVNMPVLDTGHLLDIVRGSEKQPTVVLDNTLPLSTGLPVSELLTPEDKVITVVSGTKSYISNSDLLGVGQTAHEELFDWLRRYRRTRGSLPGPSHVEYVHGCLPEDREAFDDANRALFRNTGDIALRLAELAPEDSDFVIQHPALPGHDNHELYERVFPVGGAPLLYVFHDGIDQYEVAERLWASDTVREQARLGQSFGFEHTRIVADEDVGAVRISGGSETDGKALGEACAEALYIDS